MKEKYIITGLVQGIGFRPAVKRLAEEYLVSGSVKNLGGAVEIKACGNSEQLDKFRAAIYKIPSAIIDKLIIKPCAENIKDGFVIAKSGAEYSGMPVITPDISVCDACMSEFYDSQNRRYMHPFISCTQCGPRYSVLEEIPYDRKGIVMADFDMCGSCADEYRDIKNVRCHAQTIACNQCGPVLCFDGDSVNALDKAAEHLISGGVLAIKDIGGYHLACSALSQSAAMEIRRIKAREKKPFAVMFNTVEEVREYAEVNGREEEVLLSPARPIVLLAKKKDFAPAVCGESDAIGAFLPCNPVQHYLTKKCGALVMTSANASGAPIISENTEIERLRSQKGGFSILSHNRRIVTPLDDSICRVIKGRTQLMRAARGYAPLLIELDVPDAAAAFAAGGDLKASFCYAAGGRAYLSRYFGDLEDAGIYAEWKKGIEHLGDLLGIKPEKCVCDLHPGYFSSMHTKGLGVQHHFAHMASVMAEHKLHGRTLGFVFDGTGMGTDGNIWGGEIIRYDGDFTHVGGLEYTELVGGDAAAKDSAATLDCYLYAAGIEMIGKNRTIIRAALSQGINTVKSSSMGRLFDAVSAMLDISGYNSFEGESAILLEQVAARARSAHPLKLRFTDGHWNVRKLIHDMYCAYSDGANKDSLALGFHYAVADAVCEYAAGQEIKDIVLSGGVFANRILTERCIDRLSGMGYNVYINEKVPANDGGIALGQAWISLNKSAHLAPPRSLEYKHTRRSRGNTI